MQDIAEQEHDVITGVRREQVVRTSCAHGVNKGRRTRHLPESKTELNEAQTQNYVWCCQSSWIVVGSAAVVESQLARERVDCLDLLIHGQYVVLVVMTVPCFSASESTIVLSPCMLYFVCVFNWFLLPRNSNVLNAF